MQREQNPPVDGEGGAEMPTGQVSEQGQADGTQGEIRGKLPSRIRVYVRAGKHQRGLREAVGQARRERPDILDWLKPYMYRRLKDVGLYEDDMPSPSLTDAEVLLLNRVLVAISC